MGEIRATDEGLVVASRDASLTIGPYAVTLGDGTVVSHESRGGTVSSAWSTEIGEFYVEVAHLGDGPRGGELVATVSRLDDPSGGVLTVGALWADPLPDTVPPSWPVAVDLALGLVGPRTELVAPVLQKAQLEDLHQRLLGVLHG